MILYLSEFLGVPVYDSEGRKAGAVSEVAAHPGAGRPPHVFMLLLKNGNGTSSPAVSWDQVASLQPDRISLRVPREKLAAHPSEESYLMLRKDLLDQQIIDVNGRKVVRVNDIVLEVRTSAAGSELL